MIKFFRNIRLKMVRYNKISRYLFYAIGEVVLIVIGILLALYLNNLNTEKKTKITEIKLLNELNSNLESSITSFERAIQSENEYLEYNLMILNYLDHKKPYDETLDIAFGTYFWTVTTNPVSGGYDYLKSKGIDLISNDSLRKNISLLFESEFLVLKKENEVWANNLQQNISYPYHVNLFNKYYTESGDSLGIEFAKPFDYKALLNDNKFKSINTEIISNRKWNINTLHNIVNKVKALKNQINDELEFLSD